MHIKAGLTYVILAKQLHAHHGEDEDDDTQDKGQVTQGTNGPAHDGDEQVEGRPGLGQFEHSKLRKELN